MNLDLCICDTQSHKRQVAMFQKQIKCKLMHFYSYPAKVCFCTILWGKPVNQNKKTEEVKKKKKMVVRYVRVTIYFLEVWTFCVLWQCSNGMYLCNI